MWENLDIDYILKYSYLGGQKIVKYWQVKYVT